MGVRGLQTFLRQNEHYLAQKACISECGLIIDANNLLCWMYSELVLPHRDNPHSRNDVYGGDLVLYGQVVREFFANLEKCKIVAVLVFDGSVIGKHALKDFIASKEQETLRRGLDRFNRAKVVDEFSFDEDLLLPQTLNNVFRNIAREFGVERNQSPYEADTHIARIANDLDCPVLTNDSDFFIYGLKKGFIMLDKLDYKHPQKDRLGKSYIDCSIFSQDKLTRSMRGFRVDNLPLLSVLLGNDYVKSGTFDRIMEEICNGHYEGIFRTSSFSHRRIANLLDWLSGQDLKQSIEYVLDLVHPSNRDQLNKVIRLLLRSYRIEEVDDLDAELEAIYPSSKVQKLDDGSTPMAPVAFLRKQMEAENLGSIALDMIFHNTHYNYSILDDFSLPSSSYVKFRPYSLALALLRSESYENLSAYRRKVQAKRDAFLIYDRIRGEYTRLSVEPMQILENFGPLDHLTCYSVIALEPSLKRQMLMACFHFNAEEMGLITETVSQVLSGEYEAQASLCFLLIKYIGIETKLSPKPQFVSALMITFFYYAALNKGLNKDKINDEAAYKSLLDKLSEHVNINNGKMYPMKEKSIFRRIVHFTSQLHAAYKAYSVVNSLLDGAYHPARQELFFNGTLIFRITKLLRLKEWSVEELCRDLPSLADICDSIQVQVHCS